MLRLHDTSRRSPSQSSRGGFSLVELLVSVTIFLILGALTLSAFRDSKHDKVAAGSRQFVASMGGARSRASKAVEPRGLRLLRDKADYKLISSMQYVGQSQLLNGTLRVQMDDKGVTQLLCNQAGEWTNLRNEGLLKPGTKIFLWAFDPSTISASVENSSGGRWYTIASTGFAPAGEDVNNNGSLDGSEDVNKNGVFDPGEDVNGNGVFDFGEDLNRNGVLDTNEQRMQIVGPIDGAKWIDGVTTPPALPVPNPSSVWQYQPTYDASLGPPYGMGPLLGPLASYVPGSGTRSLISDTRPIPYLLRLSPQELPDAEPINLPPGVVIDLPSSIIPASWQDFEDRNQNGTLDPTEDLNGDSILNNVHFDIPVSPNGTVGGAISGSGPIYLYVCPREDVNRMREMLSTSNGGNYGSDYSPGNIPADFDVDKYGTDHPSSERKVVCIIPQTGLVYLANVNGADADAAGSPGYGWADDPFSFARDGRETR